MNPVGLHGFSMSCALGQNNAEIWHNAVKGSTVGMVFDQDILFDGKTYLGQVDFVKQKINPFFECRINHFICGVLNQLDLSLIKQTIAKNPERVGIIIGTSTSGIDDFETAVEFYDHSGEWPDMYKTHKQRMANTSEFLADYLGVKGPVMSISTACSSSAKAMLSAKRWLNQGVCDVVLTGGVDVLCQLTINGFDALGALSYEKTLPFSENRSGINIGEAAALFVLSRERADINLYGGGESSDAHHISSPDPTGSGAVSAMLEALNDASLSANQIDYVNLHGTGTPQNDVMEAVAVNEVFGSSVLCGSSKGMTGHTLGAAGALEIGLCALSMSDFNVVGDYLPHVYDGVYDKNIMPLNLVGTNNQLGKPRFALSNSFAFGGSNASLIIGGHDD